MKVLDSPLKEYIIDTFYLDQGKVFAFEDFIITEFNEGATLDEQCFLHLYQILDVYGEGKERFGMISNRINDYAVNTSDLLSVTSMASRKYPTAIVVYNEETARTTAFELQMYKCGSVTFTDLEKAVRAISNKMLTAC